MPRLADLVALPAVAVLRRLVPQMAIHLDVMSRRELKGEITRLNYDIAITALPVDDTVANVEAVAVRDIGILVPDGHRPAGRARVSPRDLAEEPMIVLPPQTRHRQERDDIFRSFSVTPRVAVTVSSIAAAASLVGRGTGLCLADGFVGQPLAAGGLRLVRLDPARSVTYGLIRPPVPRRHQHTDLIAETLRRQFHRTARAVDAGDVAPA